MTRWVVARGARFGLVIVMAAALVAAACGGSSKTAGTTTATRIPETTVAASPTPGGASAAISIDAPDASALVRPPFVVSGAADVFEGVLVVQVVEARGKPICERTTQATAGTGTPGTWSATMAFAPPSAPSPATIRVFDRSPKDGHEENVVTRDVQLSSDQAPIVITSPKCNEDVQALTSLDVSGVARVFEGTITIELGGAQGLIERKTVTASAAAPQTGTWQTTFDLSAVPTGAYEIAAYTTSARDSAPQSIFAVPFRITT